MQSQFYPQNIPQGLQFGYDARVQRVDGRQPVKANRQVHFAANVAFAAPAAAPAHGNRQAGFFNPQFGTAGFAQAQPQQSAFGAITQPQQSAFGAFVHQPQQPQQTAFGSFGKMPVPGAAAATNAAFSRNAGSVRRFSSA